jgi:hypothetical protein
LGALRRILDANGAPLGGEFRLNTTTSGSQGGNGVTEGVRLAALGDGGFVAVWFSEDGHSAASTASGSTVRAMRSGRSSSVNRDHFVYSQSAPDVIARPGGFLVAWQSVDVEGGNWTGVFTREFGLQDPIWAAGGEHQVNTQTGWYQFRPQVTTFEDGSYLIAWLSSSRLSTGDGSGFGLRAQRYNADGTRNGGEFALNQLSEGDQGWSHNERNYSVTALDGGKFVAVWAAHAQPGAPAGQSDGDWGSYARVFNADGTPAGDQFRVNHYTSGEQFYADVTALHGANAGQFVITFRTNSHPGGQHYDVVGARFDANGVKLKADGTALAPGQIGDFLVTTVDAVNTDSSGAYEHQGKVFGLADGGWLVTYLDWYQDGDQNSVYGKRYAADGTVFESTRLDGSAGATAFLINTYRHSNQSNGWNSVTQLEDGAFVVVWQSQDQDESSWGVYAQMYNENGTLRGAEMRVNTAVSGGQADAQVVALRDGSFVVVFTSQQYDAHEGWDVYAKRFSADGLVLNEEFLVNSWRGAGDQRWPTVGATADGFVVAWEQEFSNNYDARSYDGSGSGIFAQRFTVDGLNATGAAPAIRPTLSAADAVGDEDTAIALSLTAAASGDDVLSLEISDIPVGAVLRDGAGNSFTSTVFDTAADVTGWNLAGLRITPVRDSESDFTLRVRATATDPTSGRQATNVDSIFVDVRPTIEVMTLDGASQRVNTVTEGIQYAAYNDETRGTVASWADGSYVIVWTGYDAAGFGVRGQRYDASGQPVGGEFQVNVDTAGEQIAPGVTTLADGRFVVVWRTQGAVDVFQRVFAADGTGAAETRVNAFTSSSQHTPTIEALAGGGWVVAWTSAGQDGSSNGVYAQRYAADGQKAGVEFRLNTFTENSQEYPTLAALPLAQGGGFVAVWTSFGQDGSSYSVHGQRFNAAGEPVGGEFRVNTLTRFDQSSADVAAINNGFVVVWRSHDDTGEGVSGDGDGSSWGVYGQVFGFDGQPRGEQFQSTPIGKASNGTLASSRWPTAASMSPGTATNPTTPATGASSASGSTRRATKSVRSGSSTPIRAATRPGLRWRARLTA